MLFLNVSRCFGLTTRDKTSRLYTPVVDSNRLVLDTNAVYFEKICLTNGKTYIYIYIHVDITIIARRCVVWLMLFVVYANRIRSGAEKYARDRYNNDVLMNIIHI